MLLIYNPDCSKSRAARALLDERGFRFRLRPYLERPLVYEELLRLAQQLNEDPRALVRQKEAAFREAGLSDSDPSSDLLEAIAAHPTLLQRPIVVWRDRAIIARPPERVFELVPDRHIDVEQVDFESIRKLVNETLLATTSLEPQTVHAAWTRAEFILAAVDRKTGESVGSAAFFQEPHEGTPAWRLRAMAVRDELRSLGIGYRLLEEGARAIATRDPEASLLWCNARTPAVDFYEVAGWKQVSDTFDIEGVGPHVRMTIRIEREF